MCVREVSLDGLPENRNDDCQLRDRSPTAGLLPRVVKVEANLLRYPLFALHTKGLKALDGIECSSTLVRDGQSHDFTFRATRNTSTMYPGPLARAAHVAILSLATERGLPIENPILWTWGELCRRMEVSYCGKMVQNLKRSIQATAGLLITSHCALYSKPDRRLIQTRDDALHLYERVAFAGTRLPDGTIADANYVWFADWYIQNLNAMFTAPLDYDLWRQLDARSTVASRLYEFLLLRFYRTPLLQIRYETLAQMLPVRPEKYLSHARKQLDPAFELLSSPGIIDRVRWVRVEHALAMLQIHRGERLTPPLGRACAAPALLDEDLSSDLQVKELHGLKPAEWSIVTDFYQLWAGDERYRPTPRELAQARELIRLHGDPKAKALIPLAVRQMQTKFRDAKTFGAIAWYIPEAAAEFERQQRHKELRRAEQLLLHREAEDAARKRRAREQFDATWQPAWDSLPPSEQQDIRRVVLSKNRHLHKLPRILHRLCLDELARRRAPQGAAA